MAFALTLLSHDELDVLITGESAFDDLPSAMAKLAASPGDTICHRISMIRGPERAALRRTFAGRSFQGRRRTLYVYRFGS